MIFLRILGEGKILVRVVEKGRGGLGIGVCLFRGFFFVWRV